MSRVFNVHTTLKHFSHCEQTCHHTKEHAAMTADVSETAGTRRMTRTAPTLHSSKRSVAFAGVLALIVAALLLPTVVMAKTFAITGTLDCGLKNGDKCEIGDTIAIWTSDVTGTNERVTVDVSWIKKQFEEDRWEHEDQLCLEVDDSSGKLQATGVILTCGVNGTHNPGRSTGSHEATEQPKPSQEKDQPSSNTDNSLIARINALPCTDVATGFECPIPDSLLKEANDAGLRIQFATPAGCAMVLRPSGVVIACTTQQTLP